MHSTGRGLATALLTGTLIPLIVLLSSLAGHAQVPDGRGTARTPRAIYEASCLSCHGPDGRGQPRHVVGFDLELPDFTDCAFATPERSADWHAIVQNGGPTRGFSRTMPAFGDVLTAADIDAAISHIRTFCTSRSWPRGELNLPRPLVTEKAFPENEAVLTTTFEGKDAAGNVFVYEHRLGARSQYEVVVPFNLQHGEGTGWSRGLGDVAVAAKRVLFDSLAPGSIVSVGGEVTFPTGKEELGLGGGATILEPFAAYSQMLPRDGFLHVHAGLEFPKGGGANREWYWRTAAGWSVAQNGGTGRTWSPMIEVLAARELAAGERVLWDVAPQMQVTLSKRQHIMMSGGVQFPANERDGRGRKYMLYLLWDWFDGGFFSGW